MRWKNLVDHIEYVDKVLHEKSGGSHLGGNVYCNIADQSVCVDIRQFWKPQEVVPTRKGLFVRPDEYKRLKELLSEIGNALPELNSVVPFSAKRSYEPTGSIAMPRVTRTISKSGKRNGV